ncbi:MAG: ATP-binding protein [PVC group bacterium]
MSDKAIKILLVENNPGDARLIREMLTEARGKFELEHVDRLSIALERLTQDRIDVVLLDLGLPDSLGLDTFLRVHAQAPQVPVVVMSGLDDEAVAVKAVGEGAQDYLVKGQVEGNLLGRAIRYAIQRKRAEEALHSAYQKLWATFNAIDDNMDVVDLDFNLTEVNDAIVKVFGLPNKEAVLGRKCYEVLKGRRDICPNCAVAETYKTKAPVHRMSTSEDEMSTGGRSFEIFAYPITDKYGNVTGAVEFARDITERKRAEEALRKLKAQELVVEELRELDHMKNKFIMAVTHELRTPMTPLNTSVEMLLDGTLGKITDEQRSYLEIMARNIERMSRLVKDVFSLSRLESDKYPLEQKKIQLLPLIRPTVDLLKNEADKKKIDILVNIKPEIHALVDANAFCEIMSHLIDNAILHNPEGTEVIISAKLINDNFMEVSVTDNGPGIPEDMLERVFDKFVQVERQVGPGYKGVGVGLALCKELVEKMGGRIWVESRFGEQTAFKFTLKRDDAA